MKRVTNKEIMEKLETMESDISNLQDTLADKDSLNKLLDENIKSIVMAYAALSIAYLGIGFTVLLYTISLPKINLIPVIIVFFVGSTILAINACTTKKRLKKTTVKPR